ncbi:ribonuclease H-like domain-containing protein [Tanacetum coccineum]
MSEAEPIPPTSSVTALRIPMIKKGEYDLWSMKMRQYIAITDHILWDIITNGDQATTDPASSHLLSFHDAEDAKTLWSAIKARFGVKELDFDTERFQNILSMLELYEAKVSFEDANLKFLRSPPSVWHVVATMIRGQPGLDELEFDDLYNNLKVYEHDDEIICSFFSQQASMPTTHDVEDLLQIDEDRRPIDLKAKEWESLFDKVKDWIAFNCQKLGHFARECRFAKYQENKANGRTKKKIVAIEDSNSKACDICYDGTELNFEEDDGAWTLMQEPVHFGQDRLVILTGANKLMIHQSEILGYQMSLESLEVILKTHEKNEYAWGDKYEQMEYDLKILGLESSSSKESDNSSGEYTFDSTFPHIQTSNGQKGFHESPLLPRVPQAVLSQSTGRHFYPRMDNIRPRISSFLPSTRSSTTRTPHRPQRPKKIMKSIWVKKESTVGSQAVLPQNVSVKGSAMINPTQTWRPKGAYLDSVNRDNGSYTLKQFEYGNPEEDLKDYAIIDSGCSGSMTGDKDKLSDFKEFKGGYVAFGNDPKGGRITGKGTIKTSCIDFEKVSYVEELKFNLLSVSQICDKKHNVLFTDKSLSYVSPKFKFAGVTCLVAKATKDEAVLWHRRLGHVNFKNINKLVKGNLVRGLPSKTFKLDHSCLACRKGKQHMASCKKIEERTVRETFRIASIMDLFGLFQ